MTNLTSEGQETSRENGLTTKELNAMFNDEDDDENSFSISKVQAEAGFSQDEEGHLVHGGDDAGVTSSRPVSAASTFSNNRPAYRQPEPLQLQKPFQPSSSPDHFTFRFLVYNQGRNLLSYSHGQALCQKASWLLIGCTRVNNQSEASSAS